MALYQRSKAFSFEFSSDFLNDFKFLDYISATLKIFYFTGELKFYLYCYH